MVDVLGSAQNGGVFEKDVTAMNSGDLITRRDLIALGAKVSLLPFALSAGCKSGPKPVRRPNVIFILIDTLRADRLGAYRNERDVSPTMDRIASEGVVFERPIAQAPWTQPSVASLFCGFYPGVHKVLDYNLADKMRQGLAKRIAVFDDRFITLAEVLRDNGYETAGFIANPLMLEAYGFNQGFEHYAGVESRREKVGDKKKQTAPYLNAEAIEWLKNRDSSRPFFIYFHYMDVHGPYYARDEYLTPIMAEFGAKRPVAKLTEAARSKMGYLAKSTAGEIAEKYPDLRDYREFWSALYDAGIREMDEYIADLAKSLEEMGLWDDTFVIITADHGEELYEKGIWGHGWSSYDTELYVPLIMRWPGVLPKGRRVGETVELIDVLPTVTDLLQLSPGARGEGLQGRSLVGDIDGEGAEANSAAFSEAVKAMPGMRALYLGNWKLMSDEQRRAYGLFYLATDPAEERNIAGENPGELKKLLQIIRRQDAENVKLGARTQVREEGISPEQYERLKTLGYVE